MGRKEPKEKRENLGRRELKDSRENPGKMVQMELRVVRVNQVVLVSLE